MPANLENSAVAQDCKSSVFIPIPKKGKAKECSNNHIIALLSHTSKVMLKILQARLQQYVNRELPDVQAGFRKARGTRDQIASIHWISKEQESSKKRLLLYWLCQSLWLCQFSSVTLSCPTLHDPMDHSTPSLPAHHQLLESTQSHLHWVGVVIQPSHPLSSLSPPAFNISQHQGLFKWISSLH